MHKLIRATLLGFLLFLSMFSFTSPLVRRARAYSISVYDTVDEDSNVDGVANIGTNDSSYLNAQSKDGTWQNLTEENVEGQDDTEDFHGESGSNDNITDTQDPADNGSYSTWTNWNTSDNTYNTLTEALFITNNDEDHYDSEQSNVDGYGDYGTETNPSYANDSLNSQYMNIQEANLGGGSSTEYLAEAFTDVGGDWVDEANAYDGDWGTESSVDGIWAAADDYPSAYASGFDSANSGTGTITQVDIIVRMAYTDDGSASDQWGITLDVGSSTDNVLWAMDNTGYSLANNTFTDVTEPNGGGWSWSEVWAIEIHLDGEKVGGSDSDTFEVYEFVVRVSISASDDYELDFEYRWLSADNDDNTENVSIYVQTATQSGETLKAWEWTGSAWASLGTLNSDEWNNFTASYLTGSTYTIKLNDSDQNDDGTQNNWNIDLITLRTRDAYYVFDREASFNDLDYNEVNEFLCIETGTIGSEDLEVHIWDAVNTEWDLIYSLASEDSDSWVNNSITSYLTGDNVTISFRDNWDTNIDTTENTWQIDSLLIHTWPEQAWLTGFNFRKNITVNTASGADVNYTVRFDISSLSGGDWINNSAYPPTAYLYTNGSSQADLDDIRFTSSDGITELDYWAQGITTTGGEEAIYFAENGIRQPLSHTYYPQGFFFNNVTYVTYLGWDGSSSVDTPWVAAYNHTSDTWDDPVEVDDRGVSHGDGHGIPTICVNSSGHIHILHGTHSTPRDIYHVVSTNPEDISAWTEMSGIDLGNTPCYTSVSLGSDGDTMHLFYRDWLNLGGGSYWRYYYSNSTDDGETWSTAQQIVDGEALGLNNDNRQLYMRWAENNGTHIHCAWFNEWGEEKLQNNYHYLDLSNWHLYNITGFDCGPTINSTAERDCGKFHEETTGHNTLSSIPRLDSNYNVYIVFCNGSGTTYTLCVAHWNSTASTWDKYYLEGADSYNDLADMTIISPTNIICYSTGLTGGVETGAIGGDLKKHTWDGSSWTDEGFILNVSDSGGIPLYGVQAVINGNESLEFVFCQRTGTPSGYCRLYGMNRTGTFVNDSSVLQSSGSFWVRIPGNLTESSQEIYVYYGNYGASSDSNGNDTFPFFDAFPGSSLDSEKWEVTGSGVPEVGYGYFKLAGNSTDRVTVRAESYVPYQRFALHAYLNNTDPCYATHYCSIWDNETVHNDIARLYSTVDTWTWHNTRNDGSDSKDAVFDDEPTGWHEYSITLNSSHSLMYYDQEFENTRATNIPDATNMLIYFYGAENDNHDAWIDWIFLRYWVGPEPTFTSWGSQEESGTNHRLEWEHRVTSLSNEFQQKDYFAVNVYGYASGGDDEVFNIRMWNDTSSSWSASIGTIGTSEQWYNYSFSNDYIDSGTVAWQYIDNDTTDDFTLSTLHIDYAGVHGWNFSIYGLSDFDSLEFSPDTQYYAFVDSPINFTVESGESYTVRIAGTDKTGTPVSSGHIYFNTVNNPGTSTQLTTSYQDLYVNQAAGNTTHDIYLWVNYNWNLGDPAVTTGLREFYLNLTIISSS